MIKPPLVDRWEGVLPATPSVAAGRVLRAGIVPLLVLSLAPPARAQTAGAEVKLTTQPTFQTTNQSMWGPGSAMGDFRITLFDESTSWDESASVPLEGSGTVTLEGLEFGGSLTGATTGYVRAYSGFDVEGTGAVDVTYPVAVDLWFPEVNSFRPGEEVRIRTAWAPRAGTTMRTQEPVSKLDLGVALDITASATAKVCLFGCLPPQDIFTPIDFGSTTPQELLTFESDGALSIFGGTEFQAFPHEFGFLETLFTGLSGVWDVPRTGIPCSSLADAGSCFSSVGLGSDGRALEAIISHEFIDIVIDLDAIFSNFTPLPPLGTVTPNIGGAQASFDLVDVDYPLRLTQSQAFTFDPDVELTMTFPVNLAWRVTDPLGVGKESGFGTKAVFQAGDYIHVTFPAARTAPVQVAHRYDLDNTFTSRSDMKVVLGVDETVIDGFLKIPEVTILDETVIDPCWAFTVDLDPLDVYEDKSCPETTPAIEYPGDSLHMGPVWNFAGDLPPCDLSIFPLDTDLVDCSRESTPESWELLGFAPASGTPFLLDPEDPSIAVTTTLVSGLASGTGPAGTLVQTLDVANTGDVPLSGAQIQDAIAKAFADEPGFGVRSIGSLTLTVNDGGNGYDGGDDVDTLDGTDVLPVGGSGVVTVVFDVAPGNVYASSVLAMGASPIGTPVMDDASARFAVYGLDIAPLDITDTESEAVLPVELLSSPLLDVREIDPISILLNGVAPLRFAYELDADGVLTNLALKFSREELLASIEAILAAAESGNELGGAVQTEADIQRLADALLAASGGLASALEDLDAADRLGNRNGRIDLGDLRAALYPAADPDGGTVLARAPGSRTRVALPLTGVMNDGTPFVAEDVLTLKETGRTQ